MTIIAVDDERLALDALVSSIRRACPEAEIHDFQDAAEAFEFFRNTECDVVFLDIQMPETNGIQLAQTMKRLRPRTNIIFSTGYGSYRGDAFDLHASGYLVKPILPDDVRRELAELRYLGGSMGRKRVWVQTFGSFEVFLDGSPMRFFYDRTRELLACLVDRGGAECTMAELHRVLFEQETGHEAYLKKLRQDLVSAFTLAGCEDVIIHRRGSLAVNREALDCDYYDWQAGRPSGLNRYNGEYMSQYSWAEFTRGALEEL